MKKGDLGAETQTAGAGLGDQRMDEMVHRVQQLIVRELHMACVFSMLDAFSVLVAEKAVHRTKARSRFGVCVRWVGQASRVEQKIHASLAALPG